MRMKECPYCHKEISEEAVLCKYCHNLLIDDDGNMTSAQQEHTNTCDDGKTRVFSKEELNDLEDKTRAFILPESSPADNSGVQQQGVPIASASAEEIFQNDNVYGNYQQDYDEDYDEQYYDDEEDDDEINEEAAAKKRLFIITACITIGILVVIIAAIFVGVKLFGFNGSSEEGSSAVSVASKSDSSYDSNADVDNSDDESALDTLAADSSAAASDESEQSSQASGDTDSSAADTQTSSDTETTTTTTAAADESSDTDTTTTTEAVASEADSSSQADTTTAVSDAAGDSESTVLSAISGQLDGNVTSSQFRTDDGTYLYYYFFTDTDHGYSVAYNKTTGEAVVVQNY